MGLSRNQNEINEFKARKLADSDAQQQLDRKMNAAADVRKLAREHLYIAHRQAGLSADAAYDATRADLVASEGISPRAAITLKSYDREIDDGETLEDIASDVTI